MSLMPGALVAFQTIAGTGSVHAAAKRLHLTQAAVTHRIAGLEQDLKISLFLRSRRGMQLTDAGVALLSYCRQIADIEGETLALMHGAGAHTVSHVRIQGTSSILRARVIPRTQQLLARFPMVTVEFRINDLGSDALALKRGDVDFIVTSADEVTAEIDSKRLKPERYVLVGPKAWAARSLDEIVAAERIVDFDDGDQMTLRFLEHHGLKAKARSDRHFVNNTDALAALVAAGIGYTVLAREFVEPFVRDDQLVIHGGAKHYDHQVALGWYPRRHMPPFFKALVQQMK